MHLEDNVDIVISRLEEYDFATLPVIEQSRNSVGSELHQSDHFWTFTAAVILII